MQHEIDRLRDAMHDLRGRMAAVEHRTTANSGMLEKLTDAVGKLARKDEIEEAVANATQDRRKSFWRTWQGILATAASVVVLSVAVLSLWDRFF